MDKGETAVEIYFKQLIEIAYNVYADFFRLTIKPDPFHVSITLYISFKPKEITDENFSTTVSYLFTGPEVRNLFLPASLGDGFVMYVLETLNDKIDNLIKSVELSANTLKGYTIDREFTTIFVNELKSRNL
jgi:hypothetical protein